MSSAVSRDIRCALDTLILRDPKVWGEEGPGGEVVKGMRIRSLLESSQLVYGELVEALQDVWTEDGTRDWAEELQEDGVKGAKALQLVIERSSDRMWDT